MRIMRMLVLFDLPTGSKSERRAYTLFRKFLVGDGYHMEQYSVYSRVVLTREDADKHLGRLRLNVPPAGQVTVLVLTEKQYESRRVLVSTIAHEHHQAPPPGQLTLAF